MMMWPLPDDGSFPPRRRPPSSDDADVRLAYATVMRLGDHPELRGQHITVEVQNRVVLLSGTAGSADLKRTAGDTARDVAGVVDVCNDIHIDRPAAPSPGPTPATGGRDAFEQIIHDLPAGGPARVRGPRRGTRAAAAIVAALLWAALSVLMVRHGWAGIAVTCAFAAAVAAAVLRNRRRPPRVPGS